MICLIAKFEWRKQMQAAYVSKMWCNAQQYCIF